MRFAAGCVGRKHLPAVVDSAKGPAAFVEVGVVVDADEGQVLEVGLTAVAPLGQMMRVAVAGW